MEEDPAATTHARDGGGADAKAVDGIADGEKEGGPSRDGVANDDPSDRLAGRCTELQMDESSSATGPVPIGDASCRIVARQRPRDAVDRLDEYARRPTNFAPDVVLCIEGEIGGCASLSEAMHSTLYATRRDGVLLRRSPCDRLPPTAWGHSRKTALHRK
jgi:hypothetical protein